MRPTASRRQLTYWRLDMSTQQNRQIRELVDGLSQRPDRPMPTLRPEEPRGGIPSRRGYVEKQYQPGSGGIGGIAIPLTEVEGSREYHSQVTRLYSNAFLIFAEVQPLQRLHFIDSTGAAVAFDFAQPPEIGDA